jgi:hypothetical protein
MRLFGEEQLPQWETATNSEGNQQQNVRIHWLWRSRILAEIGAEKNGISVSVILRVGAHCESWHSAKIPCAFWTLVRRCP